MKKKFLAVCALVIMSVFVVSVYASAAPAIGTGTCTAKSWCNIRTGAGTQYKKVGTDVYKRQAKSVHCSSAGTGFPA